MIRLRFVMVLLGALGAMGLFTTACSPPTPRAPERARVLPGPPAYALLESTGPPTVLSDVFLPGAALPEIGAAPWSPVACRHMRAFVRCLARQVPEGTQKNRLLRSLAEWFRHSTRWSPRVRVHLCAGIWKMIHARRHLVPPATRRCLPDKR